MNVHSLLSTVRFIHLNPACLLIPTRRQSIISPSLLACAHYELWVVIVYLTKAQTILGVNLKSTVSLRFLTFHFHSHCVALKNTQQFGDGSIHFHTLLGTSDLMVIAVFTSFHCTILHCFCQFFSGGNKQCWAFGGVLVLQRTWSVLPLSWAFWRATMNKFTFSAKRATMKTLEQGFNVAFTYTLHSQRIYIQRTPFNCFQFVLYRNHRNNKKKTQYLYNHVYIHYILLAMCICKSNARIVGGWKKLILLHITAKCGHALQMQS